MEYTFDKEKPHIVNISKVPDENEYEESEHIEFSDIHMDSTPYFNKIRLHSICSKVYALIFRESGGGQSYHERVDIYFRSSFEEIIEDAENYFDTEHNREDECDECRENDRCRVKMINDLKTLGKTGISCSCYEGCLMNILEFDIK